MAQSKPIQHNEIIVDEVFKPTIEQSIELFGWLTKIQQAFKETLIETQKLAKTNTFEKFEDVQQVTTDLNKAKEASEGLAKTTEQLKVVTAGLVRNLDEENKVLDEIQGSLNANISQSAKYRAELLSISKEISQQNKLFKDGRITIKELATTTSALIKRQSELKISNSELNRTINAQIKENKAAEGSMDQISQRLGRLRESYRGLSEEERKNIDTTGALKAGIDELDPKIKELDASIGNHQRNVGNYEKANLGAAGSTKELITTLREAGAPLRALGHALGVNTGLLNDVRVSTEHLLQLFNTQNKTTKEGTVAKEADAVATKSMTFWQNAYALAVGQSTGAMKVFRLALIATGIGAFLILVGLLVTNFEKIKEVLDIGVNPATKKLAEETKKAAKESQEAYKNFQLEERALRALEAAEIDIIKARRESLKVAEEATEAQLKAQEKLLSETISNFAKAQTAMVGNNNPRGLFYLLFGTSAKDVEEAKAQLKEVQDQLKEYQVENLETDKNEKELFLRQEKEYQDLRIANIQNELDREIELENQSYEERKVELKDNYRALEELDKNHLLNLAKIRKEFADKAAKENEAALKKQKDLENEIQKIINDSILAQIKDAQTKELELLDASFEEKFNKVKENELATNLLTEQLRGERLAIIKKYEDADFKQQQTEAKKQFNQEIADNKAQEQIELAQAELLLLNKKKSFKKEQDYEREKARILREIKLKYIEEELKRIETLTGKEFELLRANLKLLKKQLETEGLEDEAKKQEEALKKSAERTTKIFTELDKFAERKSQERQRRLDKELDASKRRQTQLEALAASGNKAAQDSIAAEDKRQAEIERKREKELQRAKRRELGITAINTYNAKVQSGDKNALQNTVKDLTLLSAAVNAIIPSFYEGTEDTGNGGNLDAKGGFGAILHPRERVITAEQNKLFGGIANDDAAQIMNLYNKGMLYHASQVPQMPLVPNMDAVVSELREVKNEIQNMPHYTSEWDEIQKAIVHSKRTKNNVVRTKYRME